ncbi:MAG TPA: TasA family protein [Acidimicrobiales bacterium]|nr:TasA family protein [Acidimicrobiales bacterium]
MPKARTARRATARKVAASALMVSAGAGMVGHGAYATFTSSATGGPQQISTGTVTVTLGATGASTNRLTVSATAVAAGDTISRSVDLINSGSLNLASVTLTTSATVSSALNTDTTNGLQMAIYRCSSAWTESGSSPAFSYTCGGSQTTVLASTPVVGSNLSLSNLTATTAGATDHLEVVLTLPTTAPNSMQGLSSTITYAFTGPLRAAQAD